MTATPGIVHLEWEDSQLLRRLARTDKQFLFAVEKGLRAATLRTQQAIFAHERGQFTFRKPSFFFGTPGRPGGVGAKVKFPSVRKERLYAEIYVADKEAVSSEDGTVRRGRSFFSLFERGGQREPATPGAKHIAVPLPGGPARPSFAGPVPVGFRFKNLALTPSRKLPVRRRRRPSGGSPAADSKPATGGVLYGKRGTYLVPGVGVYQRLRGEKQSRVIYPFLSRQTLKPRLGFVETATSFALVALREEIQLQAIDVITHNASKP